MHWIFFICPVWICLQSFPCRIQTVTEFLTGAFQVLFFWLMLKSVKDPSTTLWFLCQEWFYFQFLNIGMS